MVYEYNVANYFKGQRQPSNRRAYVMFHVSCYCINVYASCRRFHIVSFKIPQFCTSLLFVITFCIRYKSLQIVTNLYKSLQIFTNRYKSLQIVTNLYKSLQIFTNRYKSLQIVTNRYKSLQIITNLYKSLQIFTNRYKSLQILFMNKTSNSKMCSSLSCFKNYRR